LPRCSRVILGLSGRNKISYGEIEGAKPKKHYDRNSGRSDLNVSDIIGAQAGTRAKHLLYVRNNVFGWDIEGAQAGTRRRGLITKRITNPMNPEYQAIGHTQKNLRQDCVYAEPYKDFPKPKTYVREVAKNNIVPSVQETNTNIIVPNSKTFSNAATVLRTYNKIGSIKK